MPAVFVLMKKLPVGFAGSLLQFAALFQSWLVSPTHVESALLIEGKPARIKATMAAADKFLNTLKRFSGYAQRKTFIISFRTDLLRSVPAPNTGHTIDWRADTTGLVITCAELGVNSAKNVLENFRGRLNGSIWIAAKRRRRIRITQLTRIWISRQATTTLYPSTATFHLD